MTKDIDLPPITLRYNGLFDFDGLYAAVIDWAKNYGYRWHEKAYKHKVPSPKGAEHEIEWEITKEVTEYISYTISFAVHIWDLREVEVTIDGKKKNLSNARLYIVMNGKITPDWQKRFNGGRFIQWMGEKYLKWIGDVDAIYADQLYYRMWNLHALIKKYFDLQTKKFAYKGYLGEN